MIEAAIASHQHLSYTSNTQGFFSETYYRLLDTTLEHAVFVFSTLHSQHHQCKFKFVIWISVACFEVRQRSSATYSKIWDTVYVIRCIKSHLHGKNYYVMTGASPCDSFTEIREQKVSMIHRKNEQLTQPLRNQRSQRYKKEIPCWGRRSIAMWY